MIIGALLLIWWSQQTGRWYAVFAGTLLFSMALNVAAFYLFVVPPHSAGCIDLCPGRLGFPLPFATLSPSGAVQIYIGDFLLNLLLLWLLLFGGVVLLAYSERGYPAKREGAAFSAAVFCGVRSVFLGTAAPLLQPACRACDR